MRICQTSQDGFIIDSSSPTCDTEKVPALAEGALHILCPGRPIPTFSSPPPFSIQLYVNQVTLVHQSILAPYVISAATISLCTVPEGSPYNPDSPSLLPRTTFPFDLGKQQGFESYLFDNTIERPLRVLSNCALGEMTLDLSQPPQSNVSPLLYLDGDTFCFESVSTLKMIIEANDLPVILNHCHFPRLSSFSLTLTSVQEDVQVYNAFDAILRGRDSIKSLRLLVHCECASFDLKRLIAPFSHRPPLTLTELFITFLSPLGYQARVLCDFAIAFPALEHLSLNPTPTSLSPPTSALPYWEHIQSSIPKNCNLKELHVYAAGVGRFPNPMCISTPGGNWLNVYHGV